MKRTFFIGTLLLLLVIGAKAQTNLAGRVYHNSNILADKLKEATKDLDIDKIVADSIAKIEAERGQKLTDKEKAELDKKVKETKKKIEAMQEGMVTAVTIEFKNETEVVSRVKIKIDEEVLKMAGVSWLKRKALRAALAIAPETEKGTYIVQGDLIIIDPKDEPDTLRMSADGKQLSGKLDEKTPFTLTLTQ